MRKSNSNSNQLLIDQFLTSVKTPINNKKLKISENTSVKKFNNSHSDNLFKNISKDAKDGVVVISSKTTENSEQPSNNQDLMSVDSNVAFCDSNMLESNSVMSKENLNNSKDLLEELDNLPKLTNPKEVKAADSIPFKTDILTQNNLVPTIDRPSNIFTTVKIKHQSYLKDSSNPSRKRDYEQLENVQVPQLISTSPKTFKTHKDLHVPKLNVNTNNKFKLPLPIEFQKLLKIFIGLEIVLNYLKARDTVPIFHKIQKEVELQSGCQFELSHLAKILSVYPDGYIVSPIFASVGDRRVHSLTIEYKDDPLTKQFLQGLNKSSQSVILGPTTGNLLIKNLCKLGVKANHILESKSMFDTVNKMTSLLPIRRQQFQNALEDLVKAQHNLYLTENGLTWDMSTTVPKWHPNFDVESTKPINPIALPISKTNYLDELKKQNQILKNSTMIEQSKLNHMQANTTSSKQPLLDRLRAKKQVRELNRSALSSSQLETKMTDSKIGQTLDESTKPEKESDLANTKKPISKASALLERIRAKQKLREEQAKLNPPESPETIKRRSMLTRIKPIASSLYGYIRTSGKTVLAIPKAITQLHQSFPNWNISDADHWFEHIRLLVELVPTFCSLEILVNYKHLTSWNLEHYLLRFHGIGMGIVNTTIGNLSS
ncbi:hypothetical protein BC833DRAFT_563418 [Globomyces pollinis-pini]|nr:hypothetical protein BC833DRAFT_563418 [Globomyces pollinis-pini]